MRQLAGLVGLAVILSAFLPVGSSGGEWKLKVHRGEQTSDFYLADVDSLTFVDYTIPAPPMVLVPAGSFTMGDGTSYCGTQQHSVTLTHSFYLAQTEVTNQQFVEGLQWAYDHSLVTVTTSYVYDNLDGSTVALARLDMSGSEVQFDGTRFYLREAPAASPYYPQGYDPPTHPATMLSWYGAARYCDWRSLSEGRPRAYQHGGDWACNGGQPYHAAGYRLPTDAEWEYAAQYDDERLYPWGSATPSCALANYRLGDTYCVGWTTPVGHYAAGPVELGLRDMAGNLSEWCNDWHDCNLGTVAITDPVGPTSGTYRLSRGGSWTMLGTELACAVRRGTQPGVINSGAGFRIVRTATP
jgi:formylglycine-generating enzyme required for sulfatase activity